MCKRKVVFYNTYEPVVPLFRDVPMALSKDDGIEVELVVSRSTFRKHNVSLQEYYRNTNVKVTLIGISFGNPVNSRLTKTLSMITYSLVASGHALFRSADLKVFLTQPPLFSALGWLRKKFNGSPYVCILMDLYPEVLEANGWIKNSGFIGRILSHIALKIHTHAGGLVVIGRDMKKYLIGTGVSADILFYIPNWAAREPIAPLEHKENGLRQVLGFSDDDFIVLYSGNQGVSHHFDDLLSVAKSMSAIPKVKFVLIGSGPRHKEIVSFKDKCKLDNIFIFEYQSVEKLIETLSMGDIHFISLKDGFDGMVVPSKFFGALSVARPVIFQGSDNSEIAQIVKEFNCGVCVDIGDTTTLENSVRSYMVEEEKLRLQSNNAFKAYQGHYSSSIGIGKYEDIINKILCAAESGR